MPAKKKSLANKKAPAKKKPLAKKAKTQTRGSTSMMAPRKDFGAPVEAYFAKQPPDQRALLERLHALIMKAAPDAKGTLKWGRPFYEKDGPLAVLASFSKHVSITFFGSPKALNDPKGLLEGTGKAGKHVKIKSAADVDEKQFTTWLNAALTETRSMGAM